MDHPSDSKRGGVCLYYEESLGVKIIILSALNELQQADTEKNKKSIEQVHWENRFNHKNHHH